MRLLPTVLLTALMVAAPVISQTRRAASPARRPTPAPVPRTSKIPDIVPVKEGNKAATPDEGGVSSRTYKNADLGFEITFPDTWLIPGDDFENYMKKQGFDLSLKAPDSLSAVSQAQINRALERVAVLVTAYRSMPGTADNAIARVSVEDLSLEPQIKDGVDYIDAVRASYASMKLPTGFQYSDTQAEQLNSGQFAFLDTSQGDAKKRLYVRVRGTKAILLTITYSNAQDLQTFREVVSSANFHFGK